MRRHLLIFFLLLLPHLLNGQILPAEGSKLNYRVVGISVLPKKGISKYKIEIASGNYNSADSFHSKIIKTLESKKNKIIATVPSFGCDYTWCVTYYNGKKSIPENVFHHFHTLRLPDKDQQTRLRVLQPATQKYKDAYVFLDAYKELFDMDGEPVWFMPENTKTQRNNASVLQIRDLKLSDQGTITYVAEQNAGYEINYNGDTLWKTPDNGGSVSGEKSEFYHHEFTRLSNGHYMILGEETEIWNHHLPSADSGYLISPLSKKINPGVKGGPGQVPFGTVIEYDQHGNVVWSWKSSDYFRYSDIYYHGEITVHENAFFFDEKNKVIYVSFRDISRILKIKYPEGKVIGSYGEIFNKDDKERKEVLFSGQHSIKKSKKGYLYLYDNNVASHGDFPKILKLEEPQVAGGSLKEIWEYDCTGEGVLPEEEHHFHGQMPRRNEVDHMTYDFSSGGDVMELPDDCFFVNMSGPYDKVFIVSPGKEILWSAIPEEWASDSWRISPQYRASIISREEMEHLVWNAASENPAEDKILKENQSADHPSTN